MKNKKIYVHGIVKDYELNLEKYLFSENERLNAIIDQVIDYIEENFSNEDGTIWHEDMKHILNIIEGEE